MLATPAYDEGCGPAVLVIHREHDEGFRAVTPGTRLLISGRGDSVTETLSRPSDLVPLKRPLIEAVTNAYMRRNTAGTGGLVGTGGSCAEGEFRFDVPITAGPDCEAYCSYPDGAWRIHARFAPDPHAQPGDKPHDADLELFDAKDLFAQIEDAVSSWIDPFIECHSPAEFDNQIAVLQEAINALYVQDEVRIGDKAIGGGDTGEISTPTAHIRTCIADMRSAVEPLSGLAIHNLKTNYLNDIGLTISGQRALATVAGLAIVGERQAWNQTLSDLRGFFSEGTDQFNALAANGSADWAKKLTILSSLAGLGAALTAPIGPVSGGLSLVAGVAGIASNYVPAVPDASNAMLRGRDFASVWESFQQSVLDIESDLSRAEAALAKMTYAALDDLAANPGSFSIVTPTRFLETHEGSPHGELYGDNSIQIVCQRLHDVAESTREVANHQNSVAARLPSAFARHEWARPGLQGSSIGYGYDGHWFSFEKLVDSLVDLLASESRQVQWIADHCDLAAREFQAMDEQTEAAFRALARSSHGGR